MTSAPAKLTAPSPPLRSATLTGPLLRPSPDADSPPASASGAGRRPGPDLELAAAGGRDLGLEQDARDVLVGAGLHLLERHGRPGLVGEPAVAPVVEVEVGLGLDEGAPRPAVGVEHHDLVLVDPRQGAVGPAPAGLVQHLLADDAGAALHGADAVPGGRDRGAGQDVVELGEEQVVPGRVEPGQAGVARRRRRRRAPAPRLPPAPAAPRRDAAPT